MLSQFDIALPHSLLPVEVKVRGGKRKMPYTGIAYLPGTNSGSTQKMAPATHQMMFLVLNSSISGAVHYADKLKRHLQKNTAALINRLCRSISIIGKKIPIVATAYNINKNQTDAFLMSLI